MEWISVDERLPIVGELVLVKNEEGAVITGWLDKDVSGECWGMGNQSIVWDFDFNVESEVIEWMPLPDPPKG